MAVKVLTFGWLRVGTRRHRAARPRARNADLPLGRFEEAVTDTQDRFDVARAIGIVPELSPQAAEAARDRVVSESRVCAPERVRDLAVADHRVAARGDCVKEDVLVRWQPDFAAALTDALVERICLK